MQTGKKRLIIWSTLAVLIVLILVVMQFTDEIQWNEAAAYGVLLLLIGGVYELWRWLKTRSRRYRLAFGVGVFGALFLGWVNGAVGLIGSENNPANLLYLAVFAVGLIGSLVVRFKPRGMAMVLFTAAVVQFLVPVFALFVWPAKTSWGGAGVVGVFILNAIFAVIFVGSGWLFRRAVDGEKQTAG